MNKDPERQPIALIVAIDPFSLNIVKERESNITTVNHVEEVNCIFFTNKDEHGGEKNEHPISVIVVIDLSSLNKHCKRERERESNTSTVNHVEEGNCIFLPTKLNMVEQKMSIN